MRNLPTARGIKLIGPIKVKTIHSEEGIEHCIRIELLSEQHIFYEVENLGKFDMIFGMGGSRRIDANIDTATFRLTYTRKKRHSIDPININYITGENIESDYKNVIDELIRNNCGGDTLPYNTNVVATIRTTDNEPIRTKKCAGHLSGSYRRHFATIY